MHRDYEKEYEELIINAKSHKKICIFGVGRWTSTWGYPFIKSEIGHVDFFSDNDKKKWNQVIMEGIYCIPPSEIPKYNDVLCIVIVKGEKQEEITRQLTDLAVDYTVIDLGMLHAPQIIKKYLGISNLKKYDSNRALGIYNIEIMKKEKIAVYTCIMGNYDDLKQPRVIEKQCDYYYLSDICPKNLGVYQWIDLCQFESIDTKDAIMTNRYCKTHPHVFFPEYKYSIYVDGSIQICNNITDLTGKIGRAGIAAHELEGFEDAYANAVMVLLRKYGGYHIECVREQMQRYNLEGFPACFGTSKNGVLVREHNKKICMDIMEMWWNEIRNYCSRDQLSLSYVIWKNGLTMDDIGSLGCNFQEMGKFEYIPHKKKHKVTQLE